MERSIFSYLFAIAFGASTHFNVALAEDIASELLEAPEGSSVAAPKATLSNVQVSLNDLSASEARRLNHYASRIFLAVTKLATVEANGTPNVMATSAVNRDTLRFVNAATESGLQISEIIDFLGDYKTKNYTGPTPKLYQAPDGSFKLGALVFGSLPNVDNSEKKDGYLDLIEAAGKETSEAVKK
ncbi:MAG: hypothetical protein ABJ327_00730 [Litoreibacter sp.]